MSCKGVGTWCCPTVTHQILVCVAKYLPVPAGDPLQCGAWVGQCALYIVIMIFEKSVVFIVLLILQWKKVCLQPCFCRSLLSQVNKVPVIYSPSPRPACFCFSFMSGSWIWSDVAAVYKSISLSFLYLVFTHFT